MPWNQYTVVNRREEFVLLASQQDANVSELCRRFGISRKTAYKWLSRDSCEDRSRRPLRCPSRTPSDLESLVLEIREGHPAWGARKIAHVLARDREVHLACSTVNSILKRHGRIDKDASDAATPWRRFEHEQPNSMWQMDFKGHFPTLKERCHVLTVLDDHSRFNIVLQALNNERTPSVQQALNVAFELYGLPERINADNGAPWGSSGQGALTELAVWLIRLGVRLGHSRPHHPQTNGKDERFHRTLKAEVIASHQFRDIEHVQAHLLDWRHTYNCYRPHEALHMQTPATRYRTSTRAMPASLPPIEYEPSDEVRSVQDGGKISLQGRYFRVGSSLVGQPVACRPLAGQDGRYAVYFCRYKVTEIDLNESLVS